ncbi:MAG: ATP-binding cassette domain-containing protein [Kiritimatiellia bacterium]|jgi:cobalt/nickel transport system ATP-binding protein|nr:ATP-binding cassette domain-containing protein [Kiritimatiellia bacterium]
MSKENAIIRTESVSFSYQEGTLVLFDASVYAGPGEFVAMLASNGSGKTTLLEILAGLLKPQKGEVFVLNRNVNSYTTSELYQEVGIVLQNPNDQLFAPTVHDDVAYGPRNLGLSEQEVAERVEEALQWVGAEHLSQRAIHQLSFGERKRVCVAGVLAMRPGILILDEPTAGLDPAGESLMMRLLNRLNQENDMTMIMATHSVDLLPLFADRLYVLKNGKVVGHGTPDHIFADHKLVTDASLRLPYISTLVHELKNLDGAPIRGLPLTLIEARRRIMDVIPADVVIERLKNESS